MHMNVSIYMCMSEREEGRTDEFQCLSSINQVIFQTSKNAVSKPRLLLIELLLKPEKLWH